MRDWCGYEIAGAENDAVVRSPAGDVIDLGALHAAIQSDPQKQYDLYQRAMMLWR